MKYKATTEIGFGTERGAGAPPAFGRRERGRGALATGFETAFGHCLICVHPCSSVVKTLLLKSSPARLRAAGRWLRSDLRTPRCPSGARGRGRFVGRRFADRTTWR